MDNGDPSFVILNYDTYKELVNGAPASAEPENKPNPHTITNEGSSGSQSDSRSFGVGAKSGPEPVVPKPEGRGEIELLERINKDILALKAQIEEEESKLEV